MIPATILIIIAVSERLFFDLGPNIELITTATILASLYLPSKYRLLVPLTIMSITDSFLGWGLISAFTWSGFLLMSLLPPLISKLTKSNSTFLIGTGSGLIGNLIFFWWTNLGVWITDSFGMYSHDLIGLVQCYVNGLPFLKLHLVSTLMFLPIAILLAEEVKKWIKVVRFGSVLENR